MLNSYCLSSHSSKQMLKMPSIRINTLSDKSDHGLSYSIESPEAAASGWTDTKARWSSVCSFSIRADYTTIVKCHRKETCKVLRSATKLLANICLCEYFPCFGVETHFLYLSNRLDNPTYLSLFYLKPKI
jgi:hypothetical protein